MPLVCKPKPFGFSFVKLRQLSDAVEPEQRQKFFCRAVLNGSAGRVFFARFFDNAAFNEQPEHGVRRHAAYRFDFGARNGLGIRDYRKRFKGGA
jgi:hypothetical protein